MFELLNDIVFILAIFVVLLFRPLKKWFKRKKNDWKLRKKANQSLSELKDGISNDLKKDKDRYGNDLTKRLLKRLTRRGAYIQTKNEDPYVLKFNNHGYLILVQGLNIDSNSVKDVNNIFGGKYVIKDNFIHLNIYSIKNSLHHRKLIYQLSGYCQHVKLNLCGYSYTGFGKSVINMNFEYISKKKVGDINNFLTEQLVFVQNNLDST